MSEAVLVGLRRKGLRLLQKYGLFEHLFPHVGRGLRAAAVRLRREMLELGLANTDARVVADKPVTPTFLFAVLLWSAVLRELNERQAGPAPDLALLMQACDSVLQGAAVARGDSAAIRRADARAADAAAAVQPPQRRQILEPAAASALSRGLRFSAAARAGRASRIRSSRSGGPISRCCRRKSGSRWCRRARRSRPAANGGTPRAGRRRRRRRRGGASRS